MGEIPTPSLIIDLPTVQRNIARLADYARQHRIGIRPHTKTHKSIRMARLQIEAGAVGLTAAKVSEAMTMAQAADDLLIAYPALDPWRTEHIAALARSRRVRVAVDSAYAVDAIAQAARSADTAVGILVDLDVGLHRTGVQSPQDALSLAQHVARTAGVRLDGILFYPGHLNGSPGQQAQGLTEIADCLQETIDLWHKDGLAAPIISGGSSPTAFQSHRIPQLTEIRPGTYIYNDMNMVRGGHATMDDCAARVLCIVVSTAVPGKFVLDAGSKTLSQDRAAGGSDSAGFGHIIEYPQARVMRLMEEHGDVDAAACPKRPSLGERVHLVPNHICPCVNLQTVAWLRDEAGQLKLLPIDARGQIW